MNRQLRAGIVVVVLATAAVLGSATSASAHDVLVDSSPRAGETVTELPALFSITTNEPLTGAVGGANAFAMQVTDAAGRFFGDGCLSIVDATMSMGATLGEPGDYRLVWQLVSSDGHPTSGEIAFTWAPAPDVPRTAGSAQPPSCGSAATETPAPTATAGPHHAEDSGTPDIPLQTVLWIGGAVLVAAIVVTIVLLLVRRRGSTS